MVVGININFKGVGLSEVGYVQENNGKYKIKVGSEIIKVDKRYFRPSEVDLLIGNSSKEKKILNGNQNIH